MQIYTITAIQKIFADVKSIAKIITYSFQAFTLIYLVYALISQTGNVYANTILLALTVFYLIFTIINKEKKTKTAKKRKKGVKHFVSRTKLLIKTFTLGATLYSFYTATSNPSPLSLILTTLMLLSWILKVLFTAFTFLIEKEAETFEVAFKKDLSRLNFLENLKDSSNKEPDPIIEKLELFAKNQKEQNKKNKINNRAKKAILRIKTKQEKQLKTLNNQ